MKKILSFLILFILFTSCSSNIKLWENGDPLPTEVVNEPVETYTINSTGYDSLDVYYLRFAYTPDTTAFSYQKEFIVAPGDTLNLLVQWYMPNTSPVDTVDGEQPEANFEDIIIVTIDNDSVTYNGNEAQYYLKESVAIEQGLYSLQVQVQNIYGLKSAWSDHYPFKVIILDEGGIPGKPIYLRIQGFGTWGGE